MGRKPKTIIRAIATSAKARAEALKNRNFAITGASLKDGVCNYSYTVISGIGIGDSHGVSGAGIITKDMSDAFSKFNVHLAYVDDVFKHSAIEVDDIDQFHNHEHTQLYEVSAFEMKGSEENTSIVLIGTKYVSGGGRIALKTPKIPLDSLSSYKWYNELNDAATEAKNEVALYREGKYMLAEEDEESTRSIQMNILDGESDDDDKFENAKV